MRIVAPIPQQGGPRIPKKPIFLKNRKKPSKTQKLKNVQKYAKISDTPFDQRSLIHLEAWFPGGPRIPKNHFFLKNGRKPFKTQKLQNVQKYAKICVTPFDQRSLIHREAWFPGGPRIPKNPIFFEKRKKSPKAQKLKNVQRYAKISDTPFNQRSLIHRDVWFLPCFVRQNQQKKKLIFFCVAILDHFQTKMFQSETTSFHYFSPRIPNL